MTEHVELGVGRAELLMADAGSLPTSVCASRWSLPLTHG